MEDTNTWHCPLPYVHLEIQPIGDVFVCCHSLEPQKVGNLHENSLREIWEGDTRKTYEKKFEKNQGALLKHCRSCKKLEKENSVSGRDREVLRWNSYDPKNTSKGPKSLAIRYSNLCNLKCRSCKPSTSTAWFSDAKKINPDVILEKFDSTPASSPISEQISWFIENGLEKIYFAGGEALLEPDHYKTLKKIIEINPNIEVTYDTNFSIMGLGKECVYDYWKHLKDLTVSASIDGTHEKCEYLRSGLMWKTFENNWKELKQNVPNINVKIHYTVSLYNIIHFPDFINIATDLNYLLDEKN